MEDIDLDVNVIVIDDEDIKEMLKKAVAKYPFSNLMELQSRIQEEFGLLVSYRKLKRIMFHLVRNGEILEIRDGKRIVYRLND